MQKRIFNAEKEDTIIVQHDEVIRTHSQDLWYFRHAEELLNQIEVPMPSLRASLIISAILVAFFTTRF